MRFFEDGPSIPDELLEARDAGNVVFFCGAGVSRPAGLPDFLNLAKQIMARLDVPNESKSRSLLERIENGDAESPLDRVFQLLQNEYGAAEIEQAVSLLLKPPRRASVAQHSVVLRLSRSSTGSVQIVTTNFDLLFERVDKSITRHVPPILPDLASGQPLRGLVYLHGRLSSRTVPATSRLGLILGSADFGRAYLSDGWATRFVRELLENYVIVLIGYSANDPPIRYLLEGLHSREESEAARIYAFDQGTEAEVREKWRDRGVHPLAYATSRDHSALWNSLTAWADRADDPDAWRKSVVDLARSGPKTLRAFERGQVTSLIRTTVGAQAFADAEPAPTAEWCCVFDGGVRFSEVRTRPGSEEGIDSLDYYGLDDDPPRQSSDRHPTNSSAEDFFSVLPGDNLARGTTRLAGPSGHWPSPLPTRLFLLGRWFQKVMHEPTAIWWAAKYQTLHPAMLDLIEWALEHSTIQFEDKAKHAWRLLLEAYRHPSDDELAWHRFLDLLRRDGWTNRTFRQFERVVEPNISIDRARRWSPLPPKEDWSGLRISDVATADVQFPVRETNSIALPDETLFPVFQVLRHGLERASALLGEIGVIYWQTATLFPEPSTGQRFPEEKDIYFHWTATLFELLASKKPDLARVEARQWPVDEPFFFDKFRLYAWHKTALLPAKEIATRLLEFSQDSLWNPNQRRELLHTLRARWRDIPTRLRRAIEERIFLGPRRSADEDETQYERRRKIAAAKLLGWLEQNGCKLSAKTTKELPGLRKADENWRPSWDRAADHSNDIRSDWVKTNTDPSKIIDAPIGDLLERAAANSTRSHFDFTDFRPWQGVVESKPFRAVAALSRKARSGEFPAEFWQAALSYWPAQTPVRLRWLFAHRLARLPANAVAQLIYYLPQWFQSYLPPLAILDLARALDLWSKVANSLVSLGAEATQSALGETFVGGAPIAASRRTYEHALNSPIGHMARTLFDILDNLKLDAGSEIPEQIRSRLELLFDAPGEGADHAICETTLRLRWIDHWDPNWTRIRVVPFFAPSHPRAEPAWNGLLHDTVLPQPRLFELLKPNFLAVAERLSQWRWKDRAAHRLSEFVVIACYWRQKDARYISYSEARSMLRNISDDERRHAVWFLGTMLTQNEAWKSFVKPFIESAWPREVRFKNAESSAALADLATQSGDHFPDAVKTVAPYLVPIKRLESMIFRLSQNTEAPGQQIAAKFPEATIHLLDLLIPNDARPGPYGLSSLLIMVADKEPSLRQDPCWRRLNKLAVGD